MALVAEYGFNEGEGTTALDSSGNGHDGFVNGADYVEHDDGFALDFAGGGSTNEVQIADHEDFDLTNAFTLMAWVRSDGTGTQGIIEKRQQGSVDGWELSLASGGSAFVRINQASSGNDFRVDTDSDYPTNGTWCHIAATYDGSTIRIYFNGVEEGSTAGPSSVASNDRHVGIGRSSTSNGGFNGLIDDVRVFDEALDGITIQTLMNTPVSTSQATDAEGIALVVEARNPTVVTSSQVAAGTAPMAVVAQNATISVSGNVLVNAGAASISVAADDPSPSLSENALAETAEITFSVQSTHKQVNAGPAFASVEALDATVSTAETPFANPTVAPVTVTAHNATVVISAEVVSADAVAASFAVAALDAAISKASSTSPPPTYRFFPPTVEEHLAHLQGHPFLQKIVWERGVSLVRRNGTWVETRHVEKERDGELLVEGEDYFVGGFRYIIPEPIALELIAAGYEPELV